MAKKYTQQNINELRRTDRQKDEIFTREFLKTAPFCSIANAVDGQPFIHSNIFVYDDKTNQIYFHTAKEGRFRYNIENNAKVCFTVAEMGRLLPSPTALNMSMEYKSVVIFGKVTIIEDDAEAESALKILVEKYFPHLKYGVDYSKVTINDLKRTTVFKLEIERWSGKEKQVEEDFPGAFDYSISKTN